MKHTTQITALILSISTGTAVWAASDDHKGKHGPKHSFEQLDANKDGRLTQAEMAQHMQARFAAADTNKDGQLSQDELRTRMQEHASKRMEKRISRMMERRDANKDGVLSQDEMQPKNLERMFAKVDQDGDGAISKAEFEEMKEKRAKHRKAKRQKDASGSDDG